VRTVSNGNITIEQSDDLTITPANSQPKHFLHPFQK
jgi:hypothetical protein